MIVTLCLLVTVAYANPPSRPPVWSILSSEDFFQTEGLGTEQNTLDWFVDSALVGEVGSGTDTGCGVTCDGIEEVLYKWMTAITTKTPNRTQVTDPQAALDLLADEFVFEAPVGFSQGVRTRKEEILLALTNLPPTFDIRGPLEFQRTADSKQAAFVFEWTFGGPYIRGITRFRINDEKKIVSYSEYWSFNYAFGISDTTGTKEALDSLTLATSYAEKMSVKRIGSDSVISPMLNEWFALWGEDGSIAWESPVGHPPMTSRAQFNALLQAFPAFTVTARMVRVSESDRDVAMLLDVDVEGRNFTIFTFLKLGNSTYQDPDQGRLAPLATQSNDDDELVHLGIVMLCVGSMLCLGSLIYVSYTSTLPQQSKTGHPQISPLVGHLATGTEGMMVPNPGTIHRPVMQTNQNSQEETVIAEALASHGDGEYFVHGTYSLCVVGTGMSGMNALAAAMSHLPKRSRVAVLSGTYEWGGTWPTQYNFVTLHQPHPSFVVGQIPWRLKKSSDHLASKYEIVAYFNDCATVFKSYFDLHTFFGCTYEGFDELPHGIQVKALSHGGTRFYMQSSRLILGMGHNIPKLYPLPISSKQVLSIIPAELASTPIRSTVVIAGSGKSAVDAATYLLDSTRPQPAEVLMIAGRGTWFLDRDKVYPKGNLAKMWKGPKIFGEMITILLRQAQAGKSGLDTLQLLGSKGFLISIAPWASVTFYGIADREKLDLVKGRCDIIRGYVTDVVKSSDEKGASLLLKDGSTLTEKTIPLSSVILNTTGTIGTGVYERSPIVSGRGRVLKATDHLLLPAPTSFLMCHAFLGGKLQEHHESTFFQFHQSYPKENFIYTFLLGAYVNYWALAYIDLLTVMKYGLVHDIDNLYPVWRRLWPLFKMIVSTPKGLNELVASYTTGPGKGIQSGLEK